jgi:hypothetical protein
MKLRVATILLIAFLPVLSGCNSLGGVPEILTSSITPIELHPGDTALVTIDVRDKNNIVAGVVGTIREDPSRKLKLHDDGTEGDVKPGDGTWSLAVQVPLQAPPGAFNLTFTAYRSDGVAVPIRAKDGTIAPLAVDMPLTISLKQ